MLKFTRLLAALGSSARVGALQQGGGPNMLGNEQAAEVTQIHSELQSREQP